MPEARLRVRNQRVRQVFEQAALGYRDISLLPGLRAGRAAAIDARGPGRSKLRAGVGPDFDLKAQVIVVQDASGDVVQMRQRFSGATREGADDAPWGLLLFQTDNGFATAVFESQPEP